MKCPSCGFENDPDVSFCGNCGVHMPEEKIRNTDGKTFCPHCGQENPPGARFCQNCGRDMALPASVPHQIPASAPVARARKRSMPGWFWVTLVFIVIVIAGSVMFVVNKPSSASTDQITKKSPVQESAAPDVPAIELTHTLMDEGILLDDDFTDDSSGWPVFGDKSQRSEVGYQNGDFRFAFNQPSCGFDAAWSPEEYTDFILETAFSTPANIPNVGAGFTLRTAEKRWYLLWVYPALGKYQFLKDIDGQVTELISPTTSPVVRPLERAGRLYLKLKVEARGAKFDIWIGQPDSVYAFLASVSDSDLKRGHLGPSADCPDGPFTSPVEVLFEWIKVYQ